MPTDTMRAHLDRLYAASDDPWSTFTSPYEHLKYADTLRALPSPRYRHALEVGCGTGVLTRQLAARCDRVTAVDCTARALVVASAAGPVDNITFLQGVVPPIWPVSAPDLVVLSEVLYFMSRGMLAELAAQIVARTAFNCDIVAVNWLGETLHELSGDNAVEIFVGLLGFTFVTVETTNRVSYRIDVLTRRRAGTAR